MNEEIEYQEFEEKYLYPYEKMHYKYWPEGFIVWRLGTGRNVELLHIRSSEKGKGHGRMLFYHLLLELEGRGYWECERPYHSVFGFTRISNQEAQAFYKALGFELQTVQGIYKDEQAILFSQSFEKLLGKKREYQEMLK